MFGDVKQRVRDCVLHFVSCERAGEIIERDNLKSCVQMIELMGTAATAKHVGSIMEASKLPMVLDIYISDLEEPFLDVRLHIECLFNILLNEFIC